MSLVFVLLTRSCLFTLCLSRNHSGNKANITDTEAPFLDLHLSVANGFVSSKIYDKRDDFDFDIVNFPFWMVTFLVVLLMVYTFRNLLGLLESAIMLQTSTLEINV